MKDYFKHFENLVDLTEDQEHLENHQLRITGTIVLYTSILTSQSIQKYCMVFHSNVYNKLQSSQISKNLAVFTEKSNLQILTEVLLLKGKARTDNFRFLSYN